MNNQTTNQPSSQTSSSASTTTATECANCGMPKEEWRGNNGQGFEMAGKTYCCQGCATGTGCTCA